MWHLVEHRLIRQSTFVVDEAGATLVALRIDSTWLQSCLAIPPFLVQFSQNNFWGAFDISYHVSINFVPARINTVASTRVMTIG